MAKHVVLYVENGDLKNKVIPYMYKSDDFRITSGMLRIHKTVEGNFISKEKTFVSSNGDNYKVFGDWSVRKVV